MSYATSILLIDRESDRRAALSLAIKSVGFPFITESTAQIALKKAQKLKPDIVLLNSSLPESFELCHQIKSHPDFEFTFLLMYHDNSPGIRSKAFQCGSDAVFEWPCSEADLQAQLNIFTRIKNKIAKTRQPHPGPEATEPDETLKALKESELKHRALFENAGIGIGYFSTEGVLIQFNQVAAQNMGGKPEDFVGKSIIELAGKEDGENYLSRIKRVANTQKAETFEDLVQLNNQERWFLSTYSPVKDAENRVSGIQIISHDISDQKFAENALREAQWRLLDSQKTGRIGHVEYNFLTDKAIWSEMIYELYERDPKLPSPSYDEIMALHQPEDAKRLEACVNEAIKSAKPYQIDLKANLPSKKTAYYHAIGTPVTDENGRVVRILGTVQDVSERKLAEAQLAKYKKIVSSTRDGIALLDTNYRYLIVNDDYEKYSGRTGAELIGKTVAEYLGQAVFDSQIKEKFDRCLRGESVQFEDWFDYPKLGMRFVSVAYFPYYENNQIAGVVATRRDITEQRKIENALIESEARFKLAMAATNDGIYDWNLVTNEIYYSPGWKRMLGYADDELENNFSVWEALTHPDDVKKSWKMLHEHLAGKRERFEMEFKMKHKDGHWVEILSRANATFDENGKAVRVVGTHVNISQLKQTERALRESQNQLSAVLENTAGSLWATDEKLRFMLGNSLFKKNFKAAFGKDVQPGADVLSWIDADELAEWKSYYQRVLAGEWFILERKRKNQDVHSWTEYRFSPILDEHEQPVGVIVLANDISGRKEAEAALHESEERLRLALESAEEGMWEWHLDTNAVFFDKGAMQMLGYDENSFVPTNDFALNLIHPDERENILKLANNYIAGGQKKYDVEFRLRQKDGSYKWIWSVGKVTKWDENGQAICFTGIHRDITARKKAEAELQKAKANLEEAQQIARLGSWEYDFKSRRLRTSDNILNLFEISPEFRNWDWDEFQSVVHPDDWPSLNTAGRKAIQNGVEYDLEFRILTVRNETKWCRAIGKANLDAQGQVVKLHGTFQDITSHKNLETQLRHAQKMDAIGKLAGGVAHDFNNLLTAINGYSALLLSEIDRDHPNFDDLQQIREAGLRAASLTRQLLAFSRKQVLQPEVVNLNELLHNLERLLKRLIGEDIKLETKLSKELANIKADRGQIEQIIVNLAVNARDAMPGGGKLIIKTQNIYLDEVFVKAYAELEAGSFVQISISDSGIGIEKSIRDQIFEPFFTTKGTGKGTGLGLSTVYGIVKQSGGQITVYSEPGHGTTFKIYLPALEKAAALPAEKQDLQIKLTGNETILIAEDEESVLNLVVKTLKKSGYRLLTAKDGVEAIALAQKYPSEIHLLLSDVVMPNISGKELSEEMTRLHPETKVCFMSGYTDDAIVRAGEWDHDVFFIQKPFSPLTLSKKVREVLDETL